MRPLNYSKLFLNIRLILLFIHRDYLQTHNIFEFNYFNKQSFGGKWRFLKDLPNEKQSSWIHSAGGPIGRRALRNLPTGSLSSLLTQEAAGVVDTSTMATEVRQELGQLMNSSGSHKDLAAKYVIVPCGRPLLTTSSHVLSRMRSMNAAVQLASDEIAVSSGSLCRANVAISHILR